MAERRQDPSAREGKDPPASAGAGEIERLRSELAAREAQLASRFREIATLTTLLAEEERKNEWLRDELGWMAGLRKALSDRPRWWSLLPAASRRLRERKLLQRSGMFDYAAYCEIHPDVAASGGDPLDHYLRHGIHEGRSRQMYRPKAADASDA